MYKGKAPSTPPPKQILDPDERGESKDEIIARLLKQNAEKDKTIAEDKKTIAEDKKTIAEDKKTIAEDKKTIAEKDKTIAEKDNTIAEQERNVSKTKFLDFLCLVNERVYDEFTVETDRSQLAQGTTSVAGKFCPRRLRFWADFEALHDRKFQELKDILTPLDASFASPHEVSGFLSAFSPKSKNEATLRPFLRIALEKPAAAIVNEYLHAASGTPDAKTPSYVHFADEDKKTQTSRSRSSKRKLTSDTGGSNIPDRICMYDPNEEAKIKVRFLVGEYKAAHRLTAPKLQHMLESPPEDYLVKAAGVDGTLPPEDVPNDAVFSKKYPSVYLAKALCQAYHYMISGALEYGYIATGHGLLMLHVVPDDRDTLYYYRVTFTLKGAQAPLPPKKTAAAYMSTLVLLALRDVAPSDEEIDAWARDRMVWPTVRYRGKRGDITEPADLEDPDDAEGGGEGGSKSGRDGGGGGGGGDKGSAEGSGSKRTRMGSVSTHAMPRRRHGGAGDGVSTAAAQGRPLALDLPYCTQACLLGVVHQRPLDEKCPNVELHRAASLRKHGLPDRHPLTEAGIREALLVQAKAAETDTTQRCVPFGREGRYGALVHVAVTCAGYGLVAKATYVSCVDSLKHELRVYNALKACQGKLIPVCLGVMTFSSARFTSDCMMRSLLFLSYAGQDLGKPERLPLNVNLQTAMDRTAKELYDLGLRNRDIRVYNCAWNPETRRVLHFDFDQATMAVWATKTAVVNEEKDNVLVKEDDDAQEQVQQTSELKMQRSPLLKRGLNTLCGKTAGEAVQTKKLREGQSPGEDDTQTPSRPKKRRTNT